MLQTSGLFLSAHADRPVISTGTPHVTASQTNISAPRRQSRRQVPEKEKKGLGMLPRPRFADRARFELAEGCPSTVFKTVSLGRSDTCPDARSHAQVFIIQKGGMLIFGSAVGLGFACWLSAISPSVISPSVSYADSSLIRGSSSAHITRRRGNRGGSWSAR